MQLLKSHRLSGLQWLAVCAMLLCVSSASAQAAGAPVNIASILETMVNNIEGFLRAKAAQNALKDVGLNLLTLMGVGLLIWELLKGQATGRFLDTLIAEIMPLAVGWMIAYVFITGGTNLNLLVTSTVDVVGAKVSPNFEKGTGSMIATSLGQVLATIVKVWDTNAVTNTGVGVKEMIGAVAVGMSAFFMKLFTMLGVAFFMLIAVGTFVGQIVVSQITVTIAMIFMPLFVPFLIFRPLSGFFDTWLKFFVTAAFTKIVGVLMLDVADLIIKQIVIYSSALDAGSYSAWEAMKINVSVMATLILLSAVMALMMMQIKDIASGIIGGAAIGFKGWGDLNRGIVNQTVGKGAVKAGAAAGRGAAGAVGGGLVDMKAAYTASKDRMRTDAHRNSASWRSTKDPGVGRRDISKMSDRAQGAYRRSMERANASGANPGGLDKSNYVIREQHSTTDPKHADNKVADKNHIEV